MDWDQFKPIRRSTASEHAFLRHTFPSNLCFITKEKAQSELWGNTTTNCDRVPSRAKGESSWWRIVSVMENKRTLLLTDGCKQAPASFLPPSLHCIAHSTSRWLVEWQRQQRRQYKNVNITLQRIKYKWLKPKCSNQRYLTMLYLSPDSFCFSMYVHSLYTTIYFCLSKKYRESCKYNNFSFM